MLLTPTTKNLDDEMCDRRLGISRGLLHNYIKQTNVPWWCHMPQPHRLDIHVCYTKLQNTMVDLDIKCRRIHWLPTTSY